MDLSTEFIKSWLYFSLMWMLICINCSIRLNLFNKIDGIKLKWNFSSSLLFQDPRGMRVPSLFNQATSGRGLPAVPQRRRRFSPSRITTDLDTFCFRNKIKFKFECQIMQMYANFEWIGCVTSPPMMLGGTRTMRRGSVALTTQVLTPGIPGTPGMPDRPGLPLGPVKPVVQAICLIKSNSLT